MRKIIMHNGKPMNALRWDGVNIEEVKEFAGEALMQPHLCMGFVYLYIVTPDGIAQCNEGDWILKDESGVCYVRSEQESEEQAEPAKAEQNGAPTKAAGRVVEIKDSAGNVLKTIRIASLANINNAAKEFIEFISASPLQSNIFAFYGKMGAGKTTFIKALCKYLGASDVVNSPTFTIVNEYGSAKGFPIYHFDFYRIKTPAEALDIGVAEYFAAEGLSFIEWPEKIKELLPTDAITVCICEE